MKLSGQNNGRTVRGANDIILSRGRNLVYVYEIINTSKVSVSLSLSNVARQDAGIYEVVLTLYNDLVDLNCCPEQKNFILGSSGMSLQNYIVGLATVELKNAGT